MSISSEITRIQNKRDLSFQEVQNKGVTVPAGSTIDDLPGLIALIEGGGGTSYNGLELLSVDASTGKPSAWKWHGQSIPGYALQYFMHNSTVYPTIDLSEVTTVGDYGLNNSFLKPINCQNITTCGEYAFGLFANALGETITFDSLTGKTASGAIAGSVFRNNRNADYYQKIILPKYQYVGDYIFYQRAVADTEIQIGSVGYPVNEVRRMPFGYSTGSGTVTIYVNGNTLDTFKTAIQNKASSSYTFVYKAATDTTYGGSNYLAGDTILTVGGS